MALFHEKKSHFMLTRGVSDTGCLQLRAAKNINSSDKRGEQKVWRLDCSLSRTSVKNLNPSQFLLS